MTLLSLPDGCEAYSDNLYIPANIEKTLATPVYAPQKHFVDFDNKYVPLTSYGLADRLNITQLTDEQINKLTTKLTDYTDVPIQHLKTTLQQIDTDYPWEMPTWMLILVAIGGTIISIIKIVIIAWCCYLCQVRKAKAKATKISIGEPPKPQKRGLAARLSGAASSSSKTVSTSVGALPGSHKQSTPLPVILEDEPSRTPTTGTPKVSKRAHTARYDRKSDSVTVEITPAILKQAQQELEKEGHLKKPTKSPV
jgi:hypothetical protein